jgi:hypothetical protein
MILSHLTERELRPHALTGYKNLLQMFILPEKHV